jgi:orotidine-5'-phosphate decarboxylase
VKVEGNLKFAEKARRAAKTSPIVVAFDPTKKMRLEEAAELLLPLRGVVSGIKIGIPALLHLGLRVLELPKLLEGFFFIFDPKLADVGHVDRLVAEKIFGAGFDALIVQPFVGFGGGLEEVIRVKGERGVLAVCSMSHPGSEEFLNRHTEELMARSWSAGVDGFILPAQKPDLISRARASYPEALIFCPGVGFQGAFPGSAISAGADFEIVGRTILSSENPRKEAEGILEDIRAGG